MHSGMTGLANIAYNQSNSTVIILDNSTTGMTGHQQNPTTGKNLRGDPAGKIDLETLCRAMGIRRVRVVDPYDLKATEEVVTGGAGRAGTLGDHHPPPLRAAQVGGEASPLPGGTGQVQGLQDVHANRMSRHLLEGQESGHRPHPMCGLRGV